ncbi:nitronate monooxygenase [Candidatus Sumerlaeota bacterium]|nr:nitronate monooxygenase [Candidatus Sumerlaeota bacterium]
MISTVLNEMLGCKYPIMLAGIGGVSYAEVCAAVSEAGGYGVIGAAGMDKKTMVEQMKRVRELTDKPFGVDLLTAMPTGLEEQVELIIENGASSFVAALGVPSRVIEMCHKAGLLVISMAGRVKHAKQAEDAGCDIVVAQGTEAGGHTGQVAGMALMPQIVDALKIPVVGAGAIFDGRGLLAAMSFGCVGAWIGTRFIASVEARASSAYKNKILQSGEADTVISRCWTGKTLRAIKNYTTDEWEKRAAEIKPFPLQAMVMHQLGVMKFTAAGDASDGEVDPDRNCFPAGQGCGGIHEIKTCKQIIEDIMGQAEGILKAGVVPQKRDFRRPLQEFVAAVK